MTPDRLHQLATAHDNDLIGEFDATVWAKRFVQRVTEQPSIATDEGSMLAWFAGAIMAGYDHAANAAEDAVAL